MVINRLKKKKEVRNIIVDTVITLLIILSCVILVILGKLYCFKRLGKTNDTSYRDWDNIRWGELRGTQSDLLTDQGNDLTKEDRNKTPSEPASFTLTRSSDNEKVEKLISPL